MAQGDNGEHKTLQMKPVQPSLTHEEDRADRQDAGPEVAAER